MQTAEDIDQRPVKRKVGRPSKYNEAIISKAQHYLENYQETGDVIPTVAGLAQEIGIPRETLHRWNNDRAKVDFRHIMNQLHAHQERKLVNGGLDSSFNTVITKLMLSKHGYTENNDKNQGNSGITVQVNRGSVKLKSGGQELEIDTTQDTGRTIEHKP